MEIQKLPMVVRQTNLTAAGISSSPQQTKNLIEQEGFPPGFRMGACTRAWLLDDVLEWLKNRPVGQSQVVQERVVKSLKGRGLLPVAERSLEAVRNDSTEPQS
jgi:predicted DNA-binding transcriptional regulator AlpA